MTGAGVRRGAGAAEVVLVLACGLCSLALLGAGVVVGLAGTDGRVRAALTAAEGRGDPRAAAVLGAVPAGEPLGQLGLDTAIGGACLLLGAVLLLARPRTRTTRCVGLGAVAAAGGFALQSGAGAEVVGALTGRAGAAVAVRALPALAGGALLLAVLALPASRAGRAAAGAVLVLAAALGAAPVPLSWRCVLVLGLLVPVAGATALGLQVAAGGGSEQERVLGRRLLSVLVATASAGVVLAVVTAVLWGTGWTGLTLVDPTVQPPVEQQTALLFWYGRLAVVGLAAAVWAARWGAGRAAVETWFTRGLAVALVATAGGGLHVLLRTLLAPVIGAAPATALATALVAAALLPGYGLAERAADRLLHGTRPAPYSVLAGLVAFAPATTRGVADLDGLVEAVGQGLGAATCRLTVRRPGLRDRSYGWTRPGQPAGAPLQEFAVRHGGERVGTLAVDREAVAGLVGQRRELLEVALGSLGVVLQAVRSGIDLERQLRAALAHADDIATARRRLVAETDSERRRIERDLHDGAQHHLVSLRLALGLAEHLVATGMGGAARAQLDRLAAQLDGAEAVLARTASGVASPVLRERGLVVALRTELAGGTPPVTLDTTAVPVGLRLGEEREAAVWFVCLEAVANARKHAAGAAVRVRLAVSGARLEFAVEDDGPGYDRAAGSGSPGRGLRNLPARVTALGGRLEVRSAPGAGTAVRGWVPLPAEAVPGTVPAPGVPAPAAPAGPPAPVVTSPLLEDVRAVLGEAAGLYDGTPEGTSLRRLAVRLGQPVRIAVVPVPGARVGEADALAVARVLELDPRRAVAVPSSAGPDLSGADAQLLLWRAGDRPPEGGPARPTQTIGVVLADPGIPGGTDGGLLSRSCQAVVRVPPGPVPAPGGAAKELRELVEHRVLERAALLRARAAVEELEAVLRDRPPPEDGATLRYALDRIGSGAPELAELALLDALHGGELRLAEADGVAAGRLLGDDGGTPAARLGCPPDAAAEDLARAAQEQLARWRRAQWHPAATGATRAAAEVLVRTCERLAEPAGARR